MLILAYHRVNPGAKDGLSVSPDMLEAQLTHLRNRGWENVVLDELVASGDLMAQPGKFAITFDDGYRDNYTHAFPVLARLGLRATVYVSTAYVETGDCFPWVMRNTNGREPHDDDRPLTCDHLRSHLSALPVED